MDFVGNHIYVFTLYYKYDLFFVNLKLKITTEG